jgi:iron complex transport system permease protein
VALVATPPAADAAVDSGAAAGLPRRGASAWRWALGAALVVVGAALVGALVGPVRLPVRGVVLELLDRLPLVHVRSGLSPTQATLLTGIRLPRVVLGLVVGAMLSASGAAYQGTFRNPLADPYLLGVAAGAGLGATLVIVSGRTTIGSFDLLPMAAFAGAVVAVATAYGLSAVADRERSATSIVLSGIAVAAFFTAVQTYVQQRHADVLREVYSWILGRLNSTNGWSDVRLVLPYAVVSGTVLLLSRRHLDVLRTGEDEAAALGLDVRRTRLVVVGAATLGSAAVVSVSGLIGFVGIIVPHIVRQVAGPSYRRLVPLSMAFGAAFLVLTDVAARTVVSPGELPIGVVTAFFGAPFFFVVLRSRRVR